MRAVLVALIISTLPLMTGCGVNLDANSTLSIVTSTVPDGTVSRPYSAQFVATGGTPPYTWQIASGALPMGLSLSPSGLVSGTPSSQADITVEVQVTDSASPKFPSNGGGNSGSNSQAKGIKFRTYPPLTIKTTSLPAATVGSAYSQTLQATGGLAPYVWSISAGELPPGLALNVGTGAISGTPSASGKFNFTATVSDSASPTNSAKQSLTLASNGVPTRLTVTTASLASATVGVSYTATLQAAGGAPPYTWSISSGSLPAGIALDAAAGVISGTPLQSGTTTAGVTVKDSTATSASATLTLSVAPAATLQITTTSLPSGQVSSSYYTVLGATGGVTPYKWHLASGSLPAGLTLDPNSGAIYGTPSSAGDFSIGLGVQDSMGASATANLSLKIAVLALQILTTTLPPATLDAPYSASLAASGGTPPYAWSVSAGQLPPGLVLDAATGQISGTPNTAGDYNATIAAADSSSPQQTTSRAYTVTAGNSVATDQYGGVLARTCPDQTPTGWNMQKISISGKMHWVFCTPSGHPFVKRGVYYMTGDDHTDASYVPQSFDTTTAAKYPADGGVTQVNLQVQRIKTWGFNAQAPGAWQYASWGSLQPSSRVPFTSYADGGSSGAANVHQACTYSGNCKNLWNLQWPAQRPYNSASTLNITDAFDPGFVTFANARYASDGMIATQKNSPYYMGLVAGDTDNFSGFGAGPPLAGVGFATDPPGSYWEHIGRFMLLSAPRQTVNPRNNWAIFSDPTNYTKAQLATFLQARYGTIAALNTAWGSNYSSFGTTGAQVTGTALSGSGTGPYTGTLTRSAGIDPFSVLIEAAGAGKGGDDGAGHLYGPGIASGTINYSTGAVSVTFTTSVSTVTADYYHDGWGVGSGLLDEWDYAGSTHPWLGTNPYTLDPSSSSFKKDMDDFLEQYATKLFTVMKNAFKAQAPNKLFFGISNLGHVPGRSPARCPILKAAGAVLDVAQVSTDGSQAQMDFITNCLGDHPFTIWHTVTANADSDWYAYSPTALGTWNKTTQGARGTQYQTDFDNLWNHCNSTTGNCQWVGTDYWAYISVSFWEHVNFGLVSWRDNAYDGNEDSSGNPACSPPLTGFTCGGEQRSYGNFLGPVTTANKKIDAYLSAQ